MAAAAVAMGCAVSWAAGTETVRDAQTEAAFQERLVWDAVRLLTPERVPEEFLGERRPPVKCGFSICSAVRYRLDQFTAGQRELLKPVAERPSLPFSAVTPDGRFKIHYTLSGSDAVSSVDADGSGLPDYVDEAGIALALAYQVVVRDLGFRAPPADAEDGPEWDIYIRNVAGSYGWTNPDRLVATDPDVWTAFIEVDNDYTHTATRGLDGLRITLAHEFFHLVELGYNMQYGEDGYFDAQFFMEAACTYVEDLVYDGINDYYNYLDDYFQKENLRFDTFDGWREYGLCLWFHFLEKHLGACGSFRQAWDNMFSADWLGATELAMLDAGTSFGDALGLFYAWNYRTGSRADTAHFYPEGDAYPELRPGDSVTLGQANSVSVDVVATAARYVRFLDNDRWYTVSVANVSTVNLDSASLFLSLEYGSGGAGYTSVDDRVAARATVNGGRVPDWRSNVFAERQDGVFAMVALDAAIPFREETDLPDAIPNPFVPAERPFVTIPFFLKTPGAVDVCLYTPTGFQVLQRRADTNTSGPGAKRFYWDGKNDGSTEAAAGVYVYVIRQGGTIIRTGKIALVR